MPSFAITDLPQGSIERCAPTEAGWLARLGRRLLVLAGLIAGCWLLASILNGAQASAAPVPVPDTSAVKVLSSDGAAKIVHAVPPVQTPVAAVPTTVHALVAAMPTTMRTPSVTVPATLASATTHRVLAVAPVITARVVHTAPPRVGLVARSTPAGATSAAPGRTVLTRAASRSTTPNSALVAARQPVAAQASTAIQHSAARPAGPARPTSVPSPAQPAGVAGLGAGSQTAGGTAIRSLTAAFAPTSFMVSAPSSRVAARLRSTRERPSVSPD